MIKPNKKDYIVGVEFLPIQYISDLEKYIDYLELERNKNHLDNNIKKF